MTAEGPALVFESTKRAKISGTLAVGFGVVFGLSGLAGSIGIAVLMGSAGLVFVIFGVLALRARVTVTPTVLTVRNWRTARVPVNELRDLRPGSVGWYGRGTTLIARRTSGRPVKLFVFSGATEDLDKRATAIHAVLAAQ